MDPRSPPASRGTAGRAVVFAGLTVVIALAGLTVVGIPFLTAMGIAAAVTVAVAVLIAITLVPALLGFAGIRVVEGNELPRPGPRSPSRRSGVRWVGIVRTARAALLVAIVGARRRSRSPVAPTAHSACRTTARRPANQHARRTTSPPRGSSPGSTGR